MISIVLFGFSGAFVVIWLLGKILDWHAEKTNSERFPRHENGIIQGIESRSRIRHHKVAVIFIHGYTDSPEIFDQIVDGIQWDEADWMVPLLPFHGRSLLEMQDFDPEVIERFVEAFIDSQFCNYAQLILVGQSLGSTLLIRLAHRKQWSPQKVQIVLMAPAVFLYDDTRFNRFLATFYPYFRNYISNRNNASADALAAVRLKTSKKFHHTAVPSVKPLLDYCRFTEKIFQQLQFPHTILIAQDDNRVDVERLKQASPASSPSKWVVFPKGKHLLYWGQNVSEISRHIQDKIAATLPKY